MITGAPHGGLRQFAGDGSDLPLVSGDRGRSFLPATRSPPGTPLWKAMEKAAADILPGSSLVPVLLPGSTDCRYFRSLGGSVAYGANLLEPSLTFG